MRSLLGNWKAVTPEIFNYPITKLLNLLQQVLRLLPAHLVVVIPRRAHRPVLDFALQHPAKCRGLVALVVAVSDVVVAIVPAVFPATVGAAARLARLGCVDPDQSQLRWVCRADKCFFRAICVAFVTRAAARPVFY